MLLPDGVGVRNFLLTAFVRDMSQVDDVWMLDVVPEHLQPVYRPHAGRARSARLSPYTESVAAAGLRYALAYAHMFWADTRAMRFSLGLGTRGSWKTRGMHRAARLAGALAASRRGIRLLARAHAAVVARSSNVAGYERLFREIRPDVLFCSHQRPPVVIPAVIAARSLGIPTATFIFSWDNLCGKGRIPAPFDHFLVWSAHMRDELRTYYPDVPADRIHVVGTPQFDFYADPALAWSREEFFARIGADPARPLVCYSGGDIGNSPEDQHHLRLLVEHVRAGRIRRDTQVLLRPAPVDDGSRFAAVCRDHPDVIVRQPEWVRTGTHNWDQILPLPADARFLANLTRHADVNVNLGSTMTLDFAIHDRPVVNVAFDVASPPPFGTPLWDHHYRFEHYRPVIELGAARFARSSEEMAEQVQAYLDDPGLDRDGRRRLVDLQLGRRPGESTAAVIGALRTIAGRRLAAAANSVEVTQPRTA
ncbi:MAG: hypothetical protein AB7U83_00130 [Vicinamibacterales bacterium]